MAEGERKGERGWSDQIRIRTIGQFGNRQERSYRKRLSHANPIVHPPEHIHSLRTVDLPITAGHGCPALTYPEIARMKEQGLYLIAGQKGIIYVGKTSRSGKLPMRELAADFRSHTLNRKLLSEHLRTVGLEVTGLTPDIKQQWIAAAVLTEGEFREHHATINTLIRTKFSYHFLPITDSAALGRLEHFAIAILDPIYND
jgi:hypothetical protein